jgi:8-amino-7-oxononanoate synthase
VVRDYLINFARPFIYTTALSPHSVLSVLCAFNFLAENLTLQDALTKNIRTFLSLTSGIVNRTASRSAIQNLIVPGNFKVREIATILKQNNIDIRPILSPTVPSGSERLRICLHSFNTEEEIRTLANLLQISEHVLKKD